MNLADLEKELRERLQGLSLIGELDFEDDLHRLLVCAMDCAAASPYQVRLFARKYPRIFASYLVAEGIYSYEGGTYWPNLSVKGLVPAMVGEDFEWALKVLKMETFEDLVRGERIPDFLKK